MAGGSHVAAVPATVWSSVDSLARPTPSTLDPLKPVHQAPQNHPNGPSSISVRRRGRPRGFCAHARANFRWMATSAAGCTSLPNRPLTFSSSRPPQNSPLPTLPSSSPMTVLRSPLVFSPAPRTPARPDLWRLAVGQNSRAHGCRERRARAHLGDPPRQGPRGQGREGAPFQRRCGWCWPRCCCGTLRGRRCGC